jgi:hypothetical protein
VVAIDHAGNAKAGATGKTIAVAALSDRSAGVTYRGTWRTASSSAYSGGTSHYAKAAGAKATFKVTGRGFTWVASKSSSRGSARVYVNGKYVKTVSLYSATTRHRQLVYSLKWPTSATRTVTIAVLGTSGHPRVDLDAVYTWQ